MDSLHNTRSGRLRKNFGKAHQFAARRKHSFYAIVSSGFICLGLLVILGTLVISVLLLRRHISLSPFTMIQRSHVYPSVEQQEADWARVEEQRSLDAWRKENRMFDVVAPHIARKTNKSIEDVLRARPETERKMKVRMNKINNGAFGEEARLALVKERLGAVILDADRDLSEVPSEWKLNELPSASSEAAQTLKASNEARFASLRERLETGEEEELCSGPFAAVWMARQAEEGHTASAPRLRWLHIPKSSTSFFNTFVRYGCPDLLQYLSDTEAVLGGLIPESLWKVVLAPKRKYSTASLHWCLLPSMRLNRSRVPPCHECPNQETFECLRLPTERAQRNPGAKWKWTWSTATLAALADVRCGGEDSDVNHRFKLGRLPGSEETSDDSRHNMTPQETIQEASRGPPSLRAALQEWATHSPIVNPFGVVALFRAPAQRVLSAFNFDWGLHLRGDGDLYCGESATDSCFRAWRNYIHSQKGILSQRDFASMPGVSACAAKMLQGCGCATRPLLPLEDASESGIHGRKEDFPLPRVQCGHGPETLSMEFARQAATKVQHLAFVGLTDLHRASVCLFHHYFPLNSPKASEFSHFNAGKLRGEGIKAYRLLNETGSGSSPTGTTTSFKSNSSFFHDTSPLADYVDVMDEMVFEAALKRFERDLDTALGAIRRLKHH